MQSMVIRLAAAAVASVALPTEAQSFEPMSVSQASQTLASTQLSMPVDTARIAVIVNSVAILADQGDFERLESLYADEILVDYTSLWGGEIQSHTPESLMAAWAAVLPGFAQTFHNISNVHVDIVGDRATATAHVTADHYLANGYWQVSGQYEYQFAKQADQWRITHMTFNLTDEDGDRALSNLAAERARANPAAYLQQQQTEQTVRAFLTSLETKDMEAFAAVWAEDAVQDMPYSPDGFPKRVEGRENLLQHYAAWPEISGSANFTDELVFYPMADPTIVFAEWRGVVDIIPTGRLYEQRYGGLFYVIDGKIQLFREYYDPIAFSTAFGLGEDE